MSRSPLQRSADATIEETRANYGQEGSGHGFLVCGRPGTGKTTVASEVYQTLTDETEPDVQSYIHREETLEAVKRNSDWKGTLAHQADLYHPSEEDLAVVDEIYHPAEIPVWAKFFDRVTVLLVTADPYWRHYRLEEREIGMGVEEAELFADLSGVEDIITQGLYHLEIDNSEVSEQELLRATRYLARNVRHQCETL